MKIRYIWKIIPVPIIVSERLVRKKEFQGTSYGIFVAIRNEYKNNEPLIQHELEHCKQFYRTFGLHGILYNISKKWRLKSEIEAYRKTLEYKKYENRKQSEWIIYAICNNYGLDVEKEKVEKLLYS